MLIWFGLALNSSRHGIAQITTHHITKQNTTTGCVALCIVHMHERERECAYTHTLRSLVCSFACYGPAPG